ncbi:MAG: iron-sulfur cluster carrier protein MrpORP [Eubacteriales bacterium]|nr:iron-sulfur cluster carrier protein MrpORP [Eubacteriales bacterium]
MSDSHHAAAHSKNPDFDLVNNPNNTIHRVIAVVSGKGGVGKSMVTSLLATAMQRSGRKVGVLDADITGPSIPKLFGVQDQRPVPTEAGLLPVVSKQGMQVMSINVLLDDAESPVVWRGPILANTVKQFWTDVVWGDLDFMFLDMPPGTGDVPLTVFQSIPLDGIIIVTSPQDLVSMIVKKAVNMAKKMDIPIIGIVENMSHVICPGCGEKIKIFGNSVTEELALEWGIPFLGSLPIDPRLTELSDLGQIESASADGLDKAIAALQKIPAKGELATEPEIPVQATAPAIVQGSTQEETVKKIAIAAEGHYVCEHFGHCEGFNIYTTQEGKIIAQDFLANPGHKPGLLPNLLNDQGVHVVIAGGMGAGAIDIFNEKGIDVITGARGMVDQTIATYLDGKLLSTGSVCHDHQHAGDCGEH